MTPAPIGPARAVALRRVQQTATHRQAVLALTRQPVLAPAAGAGRCGGARCGRRALPALLARNGRAGAQPAANHTLKSGAGPARAPRQPGFVVE